MQDDPCDLDVIKINERQSEVYFNYTIGVLLVWLINLLCVNRFKFISSCEINMDSQRPASNLWVRLHLSKLEMKWVSSSS